MFIIKIKPELSERNNLSEIEIVLLLKSQDY